MFAQRFSFTVLLVLLLTVAAVGAPVSLDSLVGHPKLWTLDQNGFEDAFESLPVKWTSSARDSARAANVPMTLFGMPVVEMVVRFEGNKMKEVTANIYARGDAGDLPPEKFDELLEGATRAITTMTKAKMEPRGRDSSNAVHAEGRIWKTAKSQYTLEYSFVREVKTRKIPFRAEFIRLEVTPIEKQSLLASALSSSKERFVGSEHVQRDKATGDVWLKDVPMVDQGRKGYCVLATAERVMRYYGVDVDANELAQVTNSSAANGTEADALFENISKVTARMKLHLSEIERLEARDFLSLIKEYNRAAKKAGVAEVPEPGFTLLVNSIYHAMKGEVLRDVRAKHTSSMERFEHAIETKVDTGVPLLWMVQLGLLPENGLPQTSGGHVRLIIGYNKDKKEVLYSDSWGAGHELKRMPLLDAWTITNGLATIEPQ